MFIQRLLQLANALGMVYRMNDLERMEKGITTLRDEANDELRRIRRERKKLNK